MEKFYIVTEESDLNKEYLGYVNNRKEVNEFVKKFMKQNGLRQFKLNSDIAKRWIKFVSDNNIKILHKPFVGTYFNAYGRSWSRLFNVGDTIYCTYESEFDFTNPKGFKEIKASEFYKAIGE